MHSCIYEGLVRHERFAPTEHAFTYRMFMMYLDLGELDDVFSRRWFWSTKRANLAWLKRSDHFGDVKLTLDESVRQLVEQRTGSRPAGRIALLTHLRYFGYCMNPVSFYYCYGDDDQQLQTIVAEVHNTPWGETHCYTLDCDEAREQAPTESAGGRSKALGFRFDKTFHVSPFMGMDQSYDWQLTPPGNRLGVRMTNIEEGRPIFKASLAMTRREATGPQLARVLARYPLMTTQVIAGIYFNALRLYLKGTPFHSHPRKHSRKGSSEGSQAEGYST